MNPFEGVFLWAGGAVFAGALGFCGYSFVIAWSHAAAFHASAVPIDVLLFTCFALHHSVFAREPVKGWMTRFVAERLLRSAYVWIASLLLVAVCALWQPIGGEVYRVEGWRAIAHAGVQIAGVLIIAIAVRAIDVLELAGIRPHSLRHSLQIVGPYRWVRHPLYLGWLLATAGTAHMTGDRLTFAGISAFYLLLAIPLEERSLIVSFGDRYAQYRRQVRWRVLPYIY